MKRRSQSYRWIRLVLILFPWALAPAGYSKVPGDHASLVLRAHSPVDKTITGRVVDQENGEGLPGVNVLVKGTSVGTVTDVEGNYRLSAPDEAETLVFSSVGYVSQEVAIGSQTTVDVFLNADTQSLDEIVVVGYGTQKQSQITGAVSTVSSQEIQSVAAPNFEQSLQGRSTGLNLVSGSGQPDAPLRIQIRGTNSATTSTEPLIIIDGVQLNGGTSALNFINPSDIESVSVLKDASATAIYGSRGANGVILVTTKTGKAGEGRITFGYTRGITSPINMPELANADQFRQLVQEARVNSGLEGTVPPQDLHVCCATRTLRERPTRPPTCILRPTPIGWT